MSDTAATIRSVLAAAQNVTAAIPGLQGIAGAAAVASAMVSIGERLATVIDDLTDRAPDIHTQEEMRAARVALGRAISAKAEDIADRLDG